MEVNERMERAARFIRRQKSLYVQKQHFGGNLPACLTFFRGDEPVSLVIANEVQRDVALALMRMGRLGFEADTIYFSHDTYGLTGFGADAPELAPGELQARWKAGDREGISEGLLLFEAKARIGVTVGRCLQYEVLTLRKKHRVRWTDDFPMDGATGFIPRILGETMKRPTARELFDSMFHVDPLTDFGDSPEEARAKMDALTAEQMLKGELAMFVILYGVEGQYARRRVLTEKLHVAA